MTGDQQVATMTRFDWDVMPSGTSAYWPLSWDLLRVQGRRLEEDRIIHRDRYDSRIVDWAPAVDLDLSDASSFAWFDGESFVPARKIWGPATLESRARLLAGTRLRLKAVIPDRYGEGMGTNYWAPDGVLDVPFVHSALEGRWGGTAVLGDALIVPLDHPFLGDPDRADRLVRDLQDLTRNFRTMHGLPADGRHAA